MDVRLQEQIRYLELRLAECTGRPELHRNQIEAYEAHLAMARSADSLATYYRSVLLGGATMAVARAEWLDRYRNAGAIYRTLSDAPMRKAAEHCHDAAASAKSDDFLGAVAAAKSRSVPIQLAAETCRNALTRLLIAIMEWASEGSPAVARSRLSEVEAFWSILRENDPACTWQRICAHPPYRHRIPFADDRLPTIADWLSKALGPQWDAPSETASSLSSPRTREKPQEKPAEPRDRHSVESASGEAAGIAEFTEIESMIPTVEQVADPYRQAYLALDARDPSLQETRAVYERILAIADRVSDAQEFIRLLAEEDLYCRLARAPQLAIARGALAHCEPLAQPHAEYHYSQLIAALEACRSATEIEYELERANACYAVETAWNEVLLHYAIKAITATIAFSPEGGREGDESRRRTVMASYDLVCDFFARDWDAVLRNPRVWSFFTSVIFVRGQRVLVPPGARDEVSDDASTYLGEVGFAATEAFREATLWRLIGEAQNSNDPGALDSLHDRITRLPEEPVFDTPEAMRDHISDLFQQATGRTVGLANDNVGTPSTNGDSLVLWGRTARLDDWAELARSPTRPSIDLELD